MSDSRRRRRSTSAAGVSFQTPNIANNLSFETNFDGFTDWVGGAPQNVTRDNTRAYDGSWAVKRVLPDTSGFANDDGAQFAKTGLNGGLGYDRVWTRWYTYLDTRINGTHKYNIYDDPGINSNYGGLYFDGGYFQCFFVDTAGSGSAALVDLNTIVGGWHAIEVDFWRNGDTSNGGNNYPSIAVYIDNVLQSSWAFVPAPMTVINGRLNAGARTIPTTTKVGTVMLIQLVNKITNTIPGAVWVDKVSISSLGRIGP